MSITDELRECIRTANRSFEDVRNPYNDREILHIPEEQLTAIAERIRKANNDAVNKAHADGERSAIKQARSKSEDYRRGYAAGAEAEKEITGKLLKALENDYGLRAEWDGLRRFWTTERSNMENIDGGTEVERITGITDELREYAKGRTDYRPRERLLAIADRIDEQHAVKAERLEKYRAAVDAMLKEYVKLPVDADGVPVHVGDEMEWPTTCETFEVVGIGDGVLFYVEDGKECADWTGATTKRHHHEPTVEDVLREFFSKYVPSKSKDEDDAIIAEYAAKLRLADESEEQQ